MYILTIRTDKPVAEIGLYNNDQRLTNLTWQAHRQLSETIHIKIKEALAKNKLTFEDLGAVIIFKGPGSFTGLRIGFSVANALSYGLNIPIVTEGSSSWIKQALKRLKLGQNDYIALPNYGREPHITRQRK